MDRNFFSQEQQFGEWLKTKGLKQETIKDYLFYMNKFDLKQVGSPEYVIDFLNDYKNNPVVRSFLKNLSTYLKVFIEVPRLTGRKKIRIPKITTEEDWLKITDSMTNERNKIMFLLTCYCGLRRGSLLKIRPCDFNWNKCKDFPSLPEEKLVMEFGRVRHIGKGDKEGISLVPGKLMVKIGRFIKYELHVESNKNLMNERIFKIGFKRWEDLLNAASLKAIGMKINPHSLRHSFAIFLKKHKVKKECISAALNHSPQDVTEVYTQTNIDDLEEELKIKFKDGFGSGIVI